MTIQETICRKAALLPDKGQNELLAYMEYLVLKHTTPGGKVKDEEWREISIRSNLSSEGDDFSIYDGVEYRERWR